MATTDSNGIVFLEETDPISPFHTTINTLQQGTSDAIAGIKEGDDGILVIHQVANVTERAALATAYGPTASKPLYVDRQDAPEGLHLERTSDGATWTTVQTSPGAWTTITLDSGRTVDASHPVPAYRLEDNGDTLRLRGTRISFSAGLAVTSGTDYPLASGANALTAAARPVQERYGAARTYNATTPFLARITLSNTGVLSFRPSVNATIFAIEWGDVFMYLKG